MFWIGAVPDPDLEIREVWGGGGGWSSKPGDNRGAPRGPKFFFRPFGPQFGLKIKGGAPPGPSPGSATEVVAYGGWWHKEI